MSLVARSLDDLDRLAFRLSRVVRTQYPQLLAQGFTLTDLEERLLPYREVRREMAQGAPDVFESALLRLLAGERGYLETDATLQVACRQALDSPSPTLSMVRSWATTLVRLTRTESRLPARGGIVTDGRPAAQSGGSPSWAQTTDPQDVFPAPRPVALPSSRRPPEGPASASTTRICCRYCDNQLPVDRGVTFCPHCGMDLTKRQCPACSTELEAHWRFCVTCGRSD
jgi:hypothetical protein